MAYVHELNTDYPTTCPFVLEVRDKYVDWRYTMDYGYIRYHTGSNVLFEHKLVAELVHGPKPAGWHTHHIDNVRTNNAWYNLVHLSPSDHARRHSWEKYLTWCQQCGAELWKDRTRINRNTHTFCNVDCARKFNRIHIQSNPHLRKPSRESLQTLLIEIPNFCELGRMFGVSDNAVRKWAKKYELDYSHVDGRTKQSNSSTLVRTRT